MLEDARQPNCSNHRWWAPVNPICHDLNCPDLPLYYQSQGWIAIESKSYRTLYVCMVTSNGAESDRQMLWSSAVMWISVVYLAGVAIFLTIAERAPMDSGQRYSDDDRIP